MKLKRMKLKVKIITCLLFGIISFSGSFGQSQESNKKFDSIPKKKSVYRREVDTIIRHIENTYIFGRRGISDEEWSRRVKMIYEKVDDTQKDYKKFRYAERYVGLLIEDGHFDFPDGGVYNRSRLFSGSDTIFPIWVKTWSDGRVFTEKDYTNTLPRNSEILTVNGYSAKEIALLNRSLGASEERNMMEVMNNWHERHMYYHWLSFTNFLFLEGIKPPYKIEYIDAQTHSQKSVILQGMIREDVKTAYDNYVKSEKKNRESTIPKEINRTVFGKWSSVGYKNVGDGIGVLTINSFWGGGFIELLVLGTDNRYKNLLRNAMSRIARDKIETLIIDVSGNGGGMTDNLYNVLNYFTDKSVDMNTTYKLTDNNRNLIKTNLKNTNRKTMGLTKAEHKHLVASVDSIPANTIFCTDTIRDLRFTPTNPKHRFKGKVYLLTDAGTYSAAQMFAQHCKELGIGLTAGRPCGGYSSISSGNGQFVELPWWQKYMNASGLRPPFGRNGKKDRRDTFEYEKVDIFIDRPFEEWLNNENHTLDRLIEIVRKNHAN